MGENRPSIGDAVEDFMTPASMKGNQEDIDELRTYKPEDFKLENLRRVSDKPEDINWLYCLVFPAKEKPPKGCIADCKKNFKEPTYATQAQIDEDRLDILVQIEEAGFVTQSVFSSIGDQIIVKIGCNDDRLLKEAELTNYNLQLNEFSVQHVLELKIKDLYPDKEVDKPTAPVYLGYEDYDEETFERIQNRGGDGALKIFRYRNFFGNELNKDPITLAVAQKQFKAQCGMDPYKHLHIPYNSEWEEKIVTDHNVQLYKTYKDGTIFRTVDRIFLLQNALEREVAQRNGFRGGGLNLDNLKFKKKLLAFYPIQYSSQIMKARDLSPKDIYNKFKIRVNFGCFTAHWFLPFAQPVQDIRDYCGEKIAYYFSFLEFYSLWLVFSAFMGFIVFVVQMAALSEATGSIDVITAPQEVVVVSREDFDIGNFSGAGKETIFITNADNTTVLFVSTPTHLPGIIAYCALISFWGAFFLEFWKRRENTLAFKWGVSNYEQAAQVRPEFKAKYDVPDAVTGMPTPYRAPRDFWGRLVLSFVLIGTLVTATCAAFFGTYAFKAFMANGNINNTVAPHIALVVNAVVIYILAFVFKMIGRKLTDWENHRTDIQYEDQLIAKTFIFSFFNSYTTLIYFAFIKSGTNLVNQNQYCVAELEDFEIDGELGETFEVDDLFRVDTCYGALGYSLVIIFFTQLIINNVQEIGIPTAKNFFKKYFNTKKAKDRFVNAGTGMLKFGQNLAQGENPLRGEEKAVEDKEQLQALPLKSPAEAQYLLIPYDTPFFDYLELAIQFGYVTLFVAAFPLAPFLALLNNFIEVWVDASKVCLLSRRPNVKRAQDIGTWYKVFEILSYVAIVTNSAVLVFTSTELVPIPADKPDLRVWAFLIFIMTIFACKYLVDMVISDVPTDVKIMLARQDYIKEQIFLDGEDDSERIIVMEDTVKRKKRGDEPANDEEMMALFARFEPLAVDPYMMDVVREVREKMHAANVSNDVIFTQIDTNKSGTIDLNELRKLLVGRQYGVGDTVDPQLIQLFVDCLDIDGDGKITRDELGMFLDGDNAADEV